MIGRPLPATQRLMGTWLPLLVVTALLSGPARAACAGPGLSVSPARPVAGTGAVQLGEFNPDDTGTHTKQIVLPAELRGQATLRLMTEGGDEYVATQLLVLVPPRPATAPPADG